MIKQGKRYSTYFLLPTIVKSAICNMWFEILIPLSWLNRLYLADPEEAGLNAGVSAVPDWSVSPRIYLSFEYRYVG